MAAERTHAALILAAGASRRLGRPKALLRRDGETLFLRMLRQVQATTPTRIVIVLGATHTELRAELPSPAAQVHAGIECIDNPDWNEGLASSLRCGARALEGHRGACLILGCDQPALVTAHLQALLAIADVALSGCAAVDHGDGLGLPVVANPELLARAHALQGDRGLRDALNALPFHALGRLEAPELGRDIDTPADLERARADGLIDPD